MLDPSYGGSAIAFLKGFRKTGSTALSLKCASHLKAVFQWSRIPFTIDLEVPDNFELPPDWTIEILFPEQKANKVIGNILHCLKYGSRLGWFIDPSDLSILGFLLDQPPVLLQAEDSLPILPEIEFALTVNQVFGWLKMGG